MNNDSPDAVRAAIERQIQYLGEQVHRIDGDHVAIRASIDDMGRSVREIDALMRGLDGHIRMLMNDPPKLDGHWRYGQGVFLAQWSDAAARAIGNRVLTFVFAAILAGLVTWAALRGGK